MTSRTRLLLITSFLSVGVLSLHSWKVNAFHEGIARRLPETSVRAAAPRKRALLVGISDYCRDKTGAECHQFGKYWWNLGSSADVDDIQKVLLDKTKFEGGFDEVTVLKSNDDTTHKNIIKTFKSFIAQTVPGDIIYFHYSGHGGQVADDDKHGPNPHKGDEMDGLDETLIPSDYISQDDHSNDIRDDEIGDLLKELKTKSPGSVTMTFDSCFSGTIERGGRYRVRGREFRGSKPQRGINAVEEGPSGLLPQGTADSLGYVVISATRSDQTAKETEDEKGNFVGALSFALIKAFNEAGPNTTYRDAFDKINSIVLDRTREQNPQIEGNEDLKLMSGISLPPQPYIPVKVDKDNLLLQAGQIQGMTEGSLFDIFPPETKSFTNTEPLVKDAVIQTVGVTTALLKLPDGSKVGLEKLQNARAVQTLHKFGDKRLRVDVSDILSLESAADIQTRLKSADLINPDVKESGQWDVRICKGKCTNEVAATTNSNPEGSFVTLVRSDGTVIRRIADGPDIAGQIRRTLESEATFRFVNQLNNVDPAIQIELRLVPVKVEKLDARGLVEKAVDDPSKKITDAGGQLVLHENDTVMLELRNTGSTDAFVTVLDIRTDGKIGPLWPHPRVPLGQGGENKIPANGKWVRVKEPFVIKITEPFGAEIFKAIATAEQTDFSPLLSAETVGSARGNERGAREKAKPLGQFLAVATTKTRGGDVFGDPKNVAIAPQDWSTYSLALESRKGPRSGMQ